MALTPRQASHWRDTRALFLRAAAVTDQDYLAYYNLGCCAMDQGDYRQAITYFNDALYAKSDSAPWANHSRAYNNLGYAYLHEGQITNAVVSFDKALAIQPRYPEAYYNMGRAFLTNGQPDVAADCFQHALALDQNPLIEGALAEACAKMGQFPKAADTAQRALQLALNQNNRALAAVLESQLRQYQAAIGGRRP
jgi:tetratricopeptide (TPR) repeat protein